MEFHQVECSLMTAFETCRLYCKQHNDEKALLEKIEKIWKEYNDRMTELMTKAKNKPTT